MAGTRWRDAGSGVARQSPAMVSGFEFLVSGQEEQMENRDPCPETRNQKPETENSGLPG
jgi:hypothetical protein